MPAFADLRRMMVDGQVRTADVTNLRLLSAMLELPREQFVPADKTDLAYLDRDIQVSAPGQPPRKLLKPMVLAKLIQAADVKDADRVLDVGCATGYSAAVLARLAGKVVALEDDKELARTASSNLAAIKIENATVANGRLDAGWPTQGPYDVILLEGAYEVIPDQLRTQLKEGGRLVGVMRQGAVGKAMLYRSQDGDFSGRPIFDASAALLPGFGQIPEFVF
jgi:protein-L-isoaspartate(D-aspartate) O-methyltransferase